MPRESQPSSNAVDGQRALCPLRSPQDIGSPAFAAHEQTKGRPVRRPSRRMATGMTGAAILRQVRASPRSTRAFISSRGSFAGDAVSVFVDGTRKKSRNPHRQAPRFSAMLLHRQSGALRRLPLLSRSTDPNFATRIRASFLRFDLSRERNAHGQTQHQWTRA
jgi:hypothetical protein